MTQAHLAKKEGPTDRPTFCRSDFRNHPDKVLSIRFRKWFRQKKMPLFSYFLVADRNPAHGYFDIWSIAHLRMDICIIQYQIGDKSNSPKRNTNVVKSVKTWLILQRNYCESTNGVSCIDTNTDSTKDTNSYQNGYDYKWFDVYKVMILLAFIQMLLNINGLISKAKSRNLYLSLALKLPDHQNISSSC